MITLYGIPNCDTVKKARNWLDDNNIDYQFHDFRKDGLDREQVKEWIDALGWESLVNKRSTSWKALDDSIRSSLNADTAVEQILASPTLIKRPLLARADHYQVGFKADQYQQTFLANQ